MRHAHISAKPVTRTISVTEQICISQLQRFLKNILDNCLYAELIVCGGFKKILQSGRTLSLLSLIQAVPKVLLNCRQADSLLNLL